MLEYYHASYRPRLTCENITMPAIGLCENITMQVRPRLTCENITMQAICHGSHVRILPCKLGLGSHVRILPCKL